MSNTNPIEGLGPSGLPLPLLCDANGYLLTNQKTGASSVVQLADKTTLSQLAGVEVNGGLYVSDLVRQLQVMGKAFAVVKAGTTGAAQNVGVALFTPLANTKNILLYRIRVNGANGVTFFINTQTTNYALGATTPYNKNIPSANAPTVTVTSSLNIGAITGTNLDQGILTQAPFEVLQNNSYIFLPAGSAEAIIGAVQQAAAGYASVLMEWCEF